MAGIRFSAVDQFWVCQAPMHQKYLNRQPQYSRVFINNEHALIMYKAERPDAGFRARLGRRDLRQLFTACWPSWRSNPKRQNVYI